MPDPVTITISALTGGVAGAMVTAYFTDMRNRRELALKFAEKYVDQFDKLADALGLLSDPAALASVAHRNKVVNAANYLEIVATFYLGGYVDRSLFDESGIVELARKFLSEMRSAKQMQASGQLVPAFPDHRIDQFPGLVRLGRGVEPS